MSKSGRIAKRLSVGIISSSSRLMIVASTVFLSKFILHLLHLMYLISVISGSGRFKLCLARGYAMLVPDAIDIDVYICKT
jgi:hypothetical protein